MRFSLLAVNALLAYTAMAEAEVDASNKVERPQFEVRIHE